MNNTATTHTFRRFAWLLWPLALTIWAFLNTPATDLRLIALGIAWLTGLVYARPSLAAPVAWLRRWPLLLWLLWMVALIAVVVTWLLRFQPAASVAFSATEVLWLVGCGTGLLLLPFAGARQSSRRLGWLAGPVITVTTLLLLLIAVELGLRYVWVMSDNFQFSSMHRNWSALYWQPLNPLNYRDYPVPDEADAQPRIIVMGDSLAAGYGINHIDDTFPQLLNSALGDAASVHLVAQPGWGIGTAFSAMQDYPLEADVLILSHYINDINEGAAGQQYGRSFPQIRLEPTEAQRWWTDRFYLANFLYYRLFLYTQHDAVGLYNEWVYGAYSDPTVWAAYQDEMTAIIDWAAERDVPLIVLLWPDLRDIDGSQPLTQPVAAHFRAAGVAVIDMSDHLRGQSPARLTVNLFDAHPSVYAHLVAADHLTPVVRSVLE